MLFLRDPLLLLLRLFLRLHHLLRLPLELLRSGLWSEGSPATRGRAWARNKFAEENYLRENF